MLDMGAQPNLIKDENVHPDVQILRKDKLYIVYETDGFVKSLDSVVNFVQFSLRVPFVAKPDTDVSQF